MNKSPRQILVAGALLLLFVTAVAGWRHRTIDVDFMAFICGGEAVRQHADPYVMQPLYACEQRRLADLGRPDLGEVVTPSPLPVYALVPFAALSLLPTKAALLVWDAVIIASMLLSIALLRSMTRIAVPTIIAAMFVGGIFVSFALGQLAPFIIACVVVTAWAVDKERDGVAATAAALSMFEPNVGLPLCTALFFMRAKARVPLLMLAILFAGVTALAAPLAQTAAYFHTILPAHASSEIHNDEQLSMTHLLSLAGASDHIALAGGSLSYLFCSIAGTVLAVIIGRKRELQRIAIVLAPAFTSFGGTFMHVQQFVIVSVLALLVSSMSPDSRKARYGLLLVALPLIADGSIIDTIMFVCIATIIAADLFDGDMKKVALCSAAVIAVTGTVHTIRSHYVQTASQQTRMHSDVALATQHAQIPEDVWRVFINEHVFTLLGWNAVLFDIPLLVGTACVIAAAFQTATTNRSSHLA